MQFNTTSNALATLWSVTEPYILLPKEALLLLGVLIATFFVWNKRILGSKVRDNVERPGEYEETIAEVDALYVYPLKSCHGTALDYATYGPGGIEYDRRWMMVHEGSHKKVDSSWGYKTVLILPTIERGKSPSESGYLHISIPPYGADNHISIPLHPSEEELKSWPLVDFGLYGDALEGYLCQNAHGTPNDRLETPSELLSAYLGTPVLLLMCGKLERPPPRIFKPPKDGLKLYKGLGTQFKDVYPFLVTTHESLVEMQACSEEFADESGRPDLAAWLGENRKQLDMRSFRPNIVLKSLPSPSSPTSTPRYPPFSEDSWSTIWVSPSMDSSSTNSTQPQRKEQAIHLVARCARCPLTLVHPDSGVRDPAVPLTVLGRVRNKMYQNPVEELEGVEPPLVINQSLGDGKVRNGPCFGMYAVPELKHGDEAVITVGDRVRVRWRPFTEDDEARGRERAPVAAKGSS